jgi:hypothetical protein
MAITRRRKQSRFTRLAVQSLEQRRMMCGFTEWIGEAVGAVAEQADKVASAVNKQGNNEDPIDGFLPLENKDDSPKCADFDRSSEAMGRRIRAEFDFRMIENGTDEGLGMLLLPSDSELFGETTLFPTIPEMPVIPLPPHILPPEVFSEWEDGEIPLPKEMFPEPFKLPTAPDDINGGFDIKAGK